MLLSIRNLSKTYGNGVQALRGVDLEIPTGIFGLLGPNGAGKSTLMRSIATLQEPDTGSIRLGTLDVLAQKQQIRRLLGYLPQDFGVYTNVDAEALLDHIAVLKGIINRKERRELVQDLLGRTNLYEVRKKKLGTYSGGMKQRFGIAQALIGDPKLIIVDEPTAGLDPQERNRFHALLSEIGENVIVILSTHIVEDVSDLCSNMAIIAGGQVLHEGNPRAAVDAMAGKTWQKTIPRGQVPAYSSEHRVISTRLVAGRTVIHVFSPSRPDPSFDPVAPDLQDVYFNAIHSPN